MGGDAATHGRAGLGRRADRRRRRGHVRKLPRRAWSRWRSSSRSGAPASTSTRDSTEQRFTEEPREVVRGDPDAALAAADVRVELTCETPAHVQTPLEPHAAVVRWDGDGLTAWVSTQGMFDARRELARRFELAAGARARDLGVHRRRLRREAGRRRRGAARRRARARGRPAGAPRALAARGPARRRAPSPHAPDGDDSARRRDGTLVAIELAAVVEMGAGGWIFPVAEPALSLYACENVRAMTFPVRTSLRAQNAFRAPGVTEGVTVLEQAMDELAAALDIDPLELRRLNHVERRPGLGTALLEQAAARLLRPRRRARAAGPSATRCASRSRTGCCAGWAARRRSGGAAAGRRRTRRSASTRDGRALVTTGIQDIGTGTLTSARMVAAEELGLAARARRRRAAATRARTSTARSRAAR